MEQEKVEGDEYTRRDFAKGFTPAHVIGGHVKGGCFKGAVLALQLSSFLVLVGLWPSFPTCDSRRVSFSFQTSWFGFFLSPCFAKTGAVQVTGADMSNAYQVGVKTSLSTLTPSNSRKFPREAVTLTDAIALSVALGVLRRTTL